MAPVMKDLRLLKLRDAALVEEMIELLKLQEDVRKAEKFAAVKRHKSRPSTEEPG
jgi:hypothetical protein